MPLDTVRNDATKRDRNGVSNHPAKFVEIYILPGRYERVFGRKGL
jgi:hypothetical protein